jgi:hypothetical protein
MLSSGNESPAAERRQDGLDAHRAVNGQKVHRSEIKLAVIHFTNEILFGGRYFPEQRKFTDAWQLAEIFPGEWQSLRIFKTTGFPINNDRWFHRERE